MVDQRAALGPAAEQSLARDPAAAPRARERGPVVLVVESAKAVLGLVAMKEALEDPARLLFDI